MGVPTALSRRDFALLLFVCVVWALNFLMSALGLREIPPFTFTLLRFAVLLVALIAFMKRPPRDQWPRLAAVSLLVGVFHFGLSFLALRLSGVLPAQGLLAHLAMQVHYQASLQRGLPLPLTVQAAGDASW